MREKISDMPIREDKVKRLKTKILTEIEKELEIIKVEMNEYLSNDDVFDYLVKRSFALLYLKQYIEEEYTFMSYEYQDKDIIIYMVSDKYLEIWLQEDYSFVFNFLFEAEENGFNIFPLLTDHYFGYHFTNIFDSILYDKKMEEQKTEDK